MAKTIKDFVFGKIKIEEEEGTAKKHIEVLSKKININFYFNNQNIEILDTYRDTFIKFWQNYEKIEPQIAKEILKFYQEEGIEWGANELSISTIVDSIGKGVDPEKVLDETELYMPNITSLEQIRKTISLDEIKIEYIPKDFLEVGDKEKYRLGILYSCTWMDEELAVSFNPENFKIIEVALARYIYY